jgi:Fe-S cluster biogenesis protein NfuA
VNKVSCHDEELRRGIEELRPILQADGGDLEFVSYADGIVSVRLKNACVSCPMSFYTLTIGIEQRLKSAFPYVQRVVALD